MIRFKFEDNDVLVPTSWDEVTVSHFINPYFLSGNSIKLLAGLAGVTPQQLANTTEDLTGKFDKITAFMKDDPVGWKGDKNAQEIQLMGSTYKVPIDIEMKSFGQKIMLGQALQRAEFTFAAIPDAIAIYFGPQIFPDTWYEAERQEEIKQHVLELPISKVFPIADFFLALSTVSKRNGRKS